MSTKALVAGAWTTVPVPKAGTATFTNPSTEPIYVTIVTGGVPTTVKVQPQSTKSAPVTATSTMSALCPLACTLTVTVA